MLTTAANLISLIFWQPLNRNRKLKSLIRFLRWQLGSRLIRGDHVIDWVNNVQFVARNGETGVTGNIYAGLHDFEEMSFLIHFLRRDDLFVDVGANSGSYTILACTVSGAQGYAFEPVPKTFSRLIQNIRLNRIENRVTCVQAAVGSRAGYIEFTNSLDTVNHVVGLDGQETGTINVPIVTLDEIFVENIPNLMKIDVEGYETNVIIGALKTLKNQKLNCVIMELNGEGSRYGFDDSSIVAQMNELGFAGYEYNPFCRSFREKKRLIGASKNILFIRDLKCAQDRCSSSHPFEVLGHKI